MPAPLLKKVKIMQFNPTKTAINIVCSAGNELEALKKQFEITDLELHELWYEVLSQLSVITNDTMSKVHPALIELRNNTKGDPAPIDESISEELTEVVDGTGKVYDLVKEVTAQPTSDTTNG